MKNGAIARFWGLGPAMSVFSSAEIHIRRGRQARTNNNRHLSLTPMLDNNLSSKLNSKGHRQITSTE